MTQKIKIEIEIAKKQVTKVEIPQGLNPIEICMILQEVQGNILSRIKMGPKKESPIIKPTGIAVPKMSVAR